jgi:putative ABC transport system permease protein
VRMALGAQAWDILKLYLREGGRIILVGTLVGFVASVAVQKTMRSVLFGVSDSGVVALSVGTVVLALAGLAAVYIPARRAAAIEPMEALRNE